VGHGGLRVSVWHPFVSGRLARAMQIERLIRYMQDKGGSGLPGSTRSTTM
tara:strand:- start:2297 stop:2446 length:150 start_codon:yes stop_codon:yes gene_type:complete